MNHNLTNTEMDFFSSCQSVLWFSYFTLLYATFMFSLFLLLSIFLMVSCLSCSWLWLPSSTNEIVPVFFIWQVDPS